MKKAERAQIVLDTLEAYYPETPVPLDHKDHFTLWLLFYYQLNAQMRE